MKPPSFFTRLCMCSCRHAEIYPSPVKFSLCVRDSAVLRRVVIRKKVGIEFSSAFFIVFLTENSTENRYSCRFHTRSVSEHNDGSDLGCNHPCRLRKEPILLSRTAAAKKIRNGIATARRKVWLVSVCVCVSVWQSNRSPSHRHISLARSGKKEDRLFVSSQKVV